MVVLREAMGLVTHVFEEPQRVGVAGQPQRLGASRHEDLLLPLRQRDQAWRPHAQGLDRLEGRGELPLASVHEEDVRQRRAVAQEPGEPPRHHLVDAAEVVDALDGPDPIPLVPRLERQAVDELHEARHRLVPGKVRDVHALDHARGTGEAEHLGEAREPLLRVDEEDLWLDVFLEITPLGERLQKPDLVAKPGRPLELESP